MILDSASHSDSVGVLQKQWCDLRFPDMPVTRTRAEESPKPVTTLVRGMTVEERHASSPSLIWRLQPCRRHPLVSIQMVA